MRAEEAGRCWYYGKGLARRACQPHALLAFDGPFGIRTSPVFWFHQYVRPAGRGQQEASQLAPGRPLHHGPLRSAACQGLCQPRRPTCLLMQHRRPVAALHRGRRRLLRPWLQRAAGGGRLGRRCARAGSRPGPLPPASSGQAPQRLLPAGQQGLCPAKAGRHDTRGEGRDQLQAWLIQAQCWVCGSRCRRLGCQRAKGGSSFRRALAGSLRGGSNAVRFASQPPIGLQQALLCTLSRHRRTPAQSQSDSGSNFRRHGPTRGGSAWQCASWCGRGCGRPGARFQH